MAVVEVDIPGKGRALITTRPVEANEVRVCVPGSVCRGGAACTPGPYSHTHARAHTRTHVRQTLLVELPLAVGQFSWNKACKYRCCGNCLAPLETAQDNVRCAPWCAIARGC